MRRASRLIGTALLAALGACTNDGTGGGATGQSTAAAQSASSDDRRPARINGKPNLNGVWQALGAAYWNVEGGPAEAIPSAWKLGALFAVPPGPSVVQGGTIPYLSEALAQREAHRAAWPESDPETKCYRAGIPRSTYMPYPFQIVQGDGDIMFIYSYATSNRTVRMSEHLSPDEVLVEQWLGWGNGRWEDDTLVIDVFGQVPEIWLDRAGNFIGAGATVTERYTLIDATHMQYEATIENPSVFSRPFTISMPLYKRIEPDVELFEYKCVEFAEPLMYGELLKEPIK